MKIRRLIDVTKKSLLIFLLVYTHAVFSQPTAPAGTHWEPVAELTDEFEGNSLDPTKWDDYHPHWSGRAPSAFKKGNAFVEDGVLLLRSTLKKDPSTVGNVFKDIWVNAAACVSKGKTAKPGYYYEAYMKASSLSMTSSFWFRVGKFSEIDVIEHIGDPSRDNRDHDLPYQYHANTHYYGKHSGLKNKAVEWKMPTRGRDEFHLYGFWWKDANTLWFYHNDVKVMEIVPRVPLDENLKMIFDTEVFPFEAAGIPSIGLPKVENLNDDTKNTMYVDYVRTYELIGEITPTEQTAYDGGPWSIPGKIESIHYDLGGEGVAYHDADATNKGTGIRSEEGVDTENKLAEGNIGWVATDEWLEYTVNVMQSGEYKIDLKVSSINNTGSFHIEIDGEDKTGTQIVSSTNDWSVFNVQTITGVSLTKGEHIMKVYIDQGGFNLGTIDFKLETAKDQVGFLNAKTTLTSSFDIEIPISYMALDQREIEVSILKAGELIGEKQLTVNAGSDTTLVTIVLTSQPVAGNDYSYQVVIRPVGATSVLDEDKKNSITITESIVNGLAAHDNKSTRVYPNPIVGDSFTVNLEGYDEVAFIAVYDQLGRTVYETEVTGRTVDLSSGIFSSKGMYVMHLEGDNKIEMIRLMVK